jgi:hypothetical protein
MVRTLAGATSAAGVVDLVWDGLSATGTPTASGVYYYDLQEDGRTLTKHVLRLNR